MQFDMNQGQTYNQDCVICSIANAVLKTSVDSLVPTEIAVTVPPFFSLKRKPSSKHIHRMG